MDITAKQTHLPKYREKIFLDQKNQYNNLKFVFNINILNSQRRISIQKCNNI